MILRKLRSRAGASLIAALFLFLLCAMAGSTILAAATANAGRLANRRVENQAYYKTISAARVFAKGFEGKKVQITWKKTDYLNGSPTYDGWEVKAVKLKDGAYVEDTDPFAEFLEDSIEGIYGASYGASAADQVILDNYWRNDFSAAQETSGSKGFTVTLDGVAGTEVYGRIALQTLNGKIRAVFSSEKIKDISKIDPEKPNIHYEITNKDKAYLIRLDCEPDVPRDPDVTTRYFVAHSDASSDPTEVSAFDSYDFRVDTKTITFTWPDDIKIKEG